MNLLTCAKQYINSLCKPKRVAIIRTLIRTNSTGIRACLHTQTICKVVLCESMPHAIRRSAIIYKHCLCTVCEPPCYHTAGQETTSNLLSFCFILLQQHLDVCHRLVLLAVQGRRQKILLGVSKRAEAKQQGVWGGTVPQTLKDIVHFCTTFMAVFAKLVSNS